MKPLLMGSEVEYSMSGQIGDERMPAEQVHRLLLQAIKKKHQWLRDLRCPVGIYLANGSRYYLDTGAHNELSSPEVADPRQIAVYDRAAEKILLTARKDALRRHGEMKISITKNNVNAGMEDAAAWGQHEAYTCWVPLQAAAAQLIPHLVSRLPYAGAGSLSAHGKGSGFELSQRARHIVRETGTETTNNRAVFCTRAWKPSDHSAQGWTRTNLICKDSQRCSFGMYLSFGVTALLLSVINEGHIIGRPARLNHPVRAMRQISLDPWLKTKVSMADGRRLTAVAIQRLYLDEVEPIVLQGNYPAWTQTVLGHWADTLDQLEEHPLKLARRLDPYLKLTILQHELSRAGYDWVQMRRAMQILHQWRQAAPDRVVRAVLAEDSQCLPQEEQALCRRLAQDRGIRRFGLDPIRFAVRLQALELNYHELGGLFDQLDTAGHLDHVVVPPEAVQQAVHHPPAGGRAEARGRCIEERSGHRSWECDWQGVMNRADGQWYDLSDPFSPYRELSPQTSSATSLRTSLDRILRPRDLL